MLNEDNFPKVSSHRCLIEKSVAVIKTFPVFTSIRLVFFNARGRDQSAVMPVLQQIQTPTMRMISAAQKRIAVKVLVFTIFSNYFLKLRVHICNKNYICGSWLDITVTAKGGTGDLHHA